MVIIPLWFHCTLKYHSNDMSHAQIQVKTKKLWPLQVGEEKLATKQKKCCDKAIQCRDKAKKCHDKAKMLMQRLKIVNVDMEKKCRDRASNKARLLMS